MIIVEIINKLLYFLFFLSTLNVIRHIFLFARHLNKPEPEPYLLRDGDRLFLGFSIALILMTLLKGIGI